MLERWRFLRQSDRTRERIREEVNPTVLDADVVDTQMKEQGYFVLPRGTRVLVDVIVTPLKGRERSPSLGEFTLENNITCTVFGWITKPMNRHMPEGTATVDLGPSSVRMREIDERYNRAVSRLSSLLDQYGLGAENEEIGQADEALGVVGDEIDRESARLAQETLHRNPGIGLHLEHYGVDPSRVTSIAFEAAVSHHIEQPLYQTS